MNFSDYKKIILRNRFVRMTILYDLICCFMLMAALFVFDTKKTVFSIMFCYAVPIMCAGIFGTYIVSMSTNRKICLLFPSLTYHLSLLIYALLANDIPVFVLSIISFIPLLFFAFQIFTGKCARLCTIFCSSLIIMLAVAGVATALIFGFAMFHDIDRLSADIYTLLGKNFDTVEVRIFSGGALAPLLASYVSAIKAVSEEEKRANGIEDRPPESILT